MAPTASGGSAVAYRQRCTVAKNAFVAGAERRAAGPSRVAPGVARMTLPEVLQSEGFSAPGYLHVDCGTSTAAILEHAKELGCLDDLPLIGGECADPSVRERILQCLATTHACEAAESADRLGTFFAKRRS